jgi:hypothetical protein
VQYGGARGGAAKEFLELREMGNDQLQKRDSIDHEDQMRPSNLHQASLRWPWMPIAIRRVFPTRPWRDSEEDGIETVGRRE